MAIGINTNMAAIGAANNLRKSQGIGAEAMARLSSGLRINSAKDDAAGLAISTRMDSQIRGMNAAVRNANDGISLGQTAEAGLGTVQDSLQRMRELAVQSRNGTLKAEDRTALNKEFTELASEVKRTADTANFNGVNLFDGSSPSFDIQVGAGTTANDRITVTTTNLTTLNSYNTTTPLSITTTAGADAAITALDADLATVTGQRATFGAVQSRFESVVNGLTSSISNLEAAKGRIVDADFAVETQKMTRASILQQAGTAMLAQANQQPQAVLQLLRG